MSDDSAKRVNSIGQFLRRLCFIVHGMVVSEFFGFLFVASWGTWNTRRIREGDFSWAAVCLILIFPLAGAYVGHLLESAGKVSLWRLFEYTVAFILITFLIALLLPSVHSHR